MVIFPRYIKSSDEMVLKLLVFVQMHDNRIKSIFITTF